MGSKKMKATTPTAELYSCECLILQPFRQLVQALREQFILLLKLGPCMKLQNFIKRPINGMELQSDCLATNLPMAMTLLLNSASKRHVLKALHSSRQLVLPGLG